MNGELVSKKTRNEFREFLVGWTLREIEMAFEAGYVECGNDPVPQVSGQRRTLVEQYYHSLDFRSPKHVRRLIAVYEYVLNIAHEKLHAQYDEVKARRAIDKLVTSLEGTDSATKNER